MDSKIYRVAFLALAVSLLSGIAADSSVQLWFVTGQNADLMLSGVDFNNTGGALMFNHPTDIASDGVHFLLCDRFNNRVLVWNTLPDRWDAQPDLVLGQRNFTENNPGTSKSEMNWPGNVSVADNGRVAVADTYNDRILIWNRFPTQSGQTADISISLRLPGPANYIWPWGVWTDGTRLVATSTQATAAILFWNSLTNVDDQAPDYTIRLPQFGTPRNISTDGSTYFSVSDHNGSVDGHQADQPVTFFWNSFPRQANQPFDFYRYEWIKGSKLPNGQWAAGGLNAVFIWASVPTSAGQDPVLTLRNQYYQNGDGPNVLFAGGRLYVNNYIGNNVQVYNGIPTSSSQLPDFALGSPSININTLETLNFLGNPNVYTDGTALFASGFFAKLWIWKSLPQRSGQAPDVRMDLNFQPVGLGLFDGKLVGAGPNVGPGDKVAVWESYPLNGEPPSYAIADHIGSFVLSQVTGVALDQSFFYLARANGTLAMWRGIPRTGNEEPFLTIADLDTSLNQIHSDGTYLCAASGTSQKIHIFRVKDMEGGGTVRPFKTLRNFPSAAWLRFRRRAPSHSITAWRSRIRAQTWCTYGRTSRMPAISIV